MSLHPDVDPALLVMATLLGLALAVAGAVLGSKRERRGWVLRGLMVLVLAAAALRPGWGSVPARTEPADVEVLLVIDRTTSMSATDWNGEKPRLAGVRRDTADLVATLPAARFTVMSFGEEVRLELPSTSDVALIRETMSSLDPERPLSGTGSLVDRPLDVLLRLLQDAEQRHPERRRVVVLMTDGENTAPGRQRSFTPLDALTDRALVLGYGTNVGAAMPLDSDHPEDGWIQDPATGGTAISRMDGQNLRRVSGELDARYLHRTRPGGLQVVTAPWEREFVQQVDEGADVPVELELSWLLGLLLAVLVLLDLSTHWRRFVQTRRELAL